jgi:uncharacterized protein YndB with AHSA1/START domain
MTDTVDTSPISDRELVLTRIFDAPRELVFKAWTDPEILPLWWAPRPFTTPVCEMDLRPGGQFRTVMVSAEGEEYPNDGVYLEIKPNEKIVFTDGLTVGWEPTGKPFMVAKVMFEDLGGKTEYTAIAQHWTVADRETHEKMGFHEGWGICADQLAAVLETLKK